MKTLLNYFTFLAIKNDLAFDLHQNQLTIKNVLQNKFVLTLSGNYTYISIHIDNKKVSHCIANEPLNNKDLTEVKREFNKYFL